MTCVRRRVSLPHPSFPICLKAGLYLQRKSTLSNGLLLLCILVCEDPLFWAESRLNPYVGGADTVGDEHFLIRAVHLKRR